jgi:hypothetical protein
MAAGANFAAAMRHAETPGPERPDSMIIFSSFNAFRAHKSDIFPRETTGTREEMSMIKLGEGSLRNMGARCGRWGFAAEGGALLRGDRASYGG